MLDRHMLLMYNNIKHYWRFDMEFRVLKYFLAIAREQSISGAAESLHISQPTLSRQIKDLENELGKTLFIRGSHRITLTEEGMILRKRAEEMAELIRRTENEIALSDQGVAGDVCIAAGETDGIRLIANLIKKLDEDYPLIKYHFISGNKSFVTEQLDKGLADFGLTFGSVDNDKYEHFILPAKDAWGVLMRRNSELAKKDRITVDDLLDKPLIVSKEISKNDHISKWFGCDIHTLNIRATYNLATNAMILADEGIGYVVCFDKLFNVSGKSKLCFRPLYPVVEASMQIIWKKYQPQTKAAAKFLEALREIK